MNRSLLFLPLAVLTTGCGRTGDIWLIEVDTTKGDGYACANEYTTNFSGRLTSTADDPSQKLTEGFEYQGPKALFYAKIVDLASGQASLNSGGLLLPGEKSGKEWVFSWTAATTNTTNVKHEADYEYESVYRSTGTTTIELDFSGGTAEGEITLERGDSFDQSESDTWGEEVSQDVGQTGRITWDTLDGVESNGRDTSECEGDDCRRYRATVCSGTAPVVATRTDLHNDEDFSSLVTLVQYGALRTSEEYSLGGNYDTGY